MATFSFIFHELNLLPMEKKYSRKYYYVGVINIRNTCVFNQIYMGEKRKKYYAVLYPYTFNAWHFY